MTAALDRDEILRRFEALLDSALTSEAPPSGIGAEILASVMDGGEDDDRRCDSYALWAAMTALTQEIKLQGRAFQELNHTLAGQTAKVAEELRAVYAERERTLQREVERRCRREALGALIDLRDRLVRGRESVRTNKAERASAARTSWLTRVLGKQTPDPATHEALGALVRGYELGIERLDQTLGEFQAQEIRCQGESFDPRRMNAIDSEESATVPDGTVLEIYRSGYEWNGEIFRPAEVKVSRAPASPQQ
jgi:molecular chaperone GrpE (heat shock protein)